MKKAKAILIALFFIANLFADCDLRFGDGKIVEFVDKLAFATVMPGGSKDGEGSGTGGVKIGVEGTFKGQKIQGMCRQSLIDVLFRGAYITYTMCKIIDNYFWICEANYYSQCLRS